LLYHDTNASLMPLNVLKDLKNGLKLLQHRFHCNECSSGQVFTGTKGSMGLLPSGISVVVTCEPLT
jgi:hypothetical protein